MTAAPLVGKGGALGVGVIVLPGRECTVLRSLHFNPEGQGAACTPVARSRPGSDHVPSHGIVVGDENGLVASATNMTKALRSPAPLLDTSIGVPGACPGID